MEKDQKQMGTKNGGFVVRKNKAISLLADWAFWKVDDHDMGGYSHQSVLVNYNQNVVYESLELGLSNGKVIYKANLNPPGTRNSGKSKPLIGGRLAKNYLQQLDEYLNNNLSNSVYQLSLVYFYHPNMTLRALGAKYSLDPGAICCAKNKAINLCVTSI